MITNGRRADWPGDVPIDGHADMQLPIPSKIRTAKLADDRGRASTPARAPDAGELVARPFDAAAVTSDGMRGMTNRLYYGDNLDVLRSYIADASVDLIYLDPPFNSNASYNILFKSPTGAGADASIEAFDDTWQWGPAAARQGVSCERAAIR